jgi:hypothetical protein
VSTDTAATAMAIANAPTWDVRVQRVRQVPEMYGLAQQARVYAAIAEHVYKPSLSPMFAHVPWREDYELGPFKEAYAEAYERTAGFVNVTDEDLREALLNAPRSLRVFRMLLGYTADELQPRSECTWPSKDVPNGSARPASLQWSTGANQPRWSQPPLPKRSTVL